MSSLRFLLPLVSLLAAAPVPVLASDAQTYADCMKLAREKPRDGFEKAGEWESFGGGTAAKHCRATALQGLGEPEAAAELLETLAQTSRETAEIKAALLRQAAQAWMQAGQGLRALGVLDAALKVTPGAPPLLEDRALVHGELGEWWAAIDDLNAALDGQPDRVSALILRAAAYRRLEVADLARADVERALALAPGDLDALVEKGNLDHAAGDDAAAREAWMTVLRTAPDSAAADVVRENLAAMDVDAN